MCEGLRELRTQRHVGTRLLLCRVNHPALRCCCCCRCRCALGPDQLKYLPCPRFLHSPTRQDVLYYHGGGQGGLEKGRRDLWGSLTSLGATACRDNVALMQGQSPDVAAAAALLLALRCRIGH